ncbi:hypothetical protein [Acinetobacter baumannii]|uniref:hypothetical protein n=1 Tax=Acinetobacter baumannii TaxID=470 RepID=UPI001D178F3A
MDNKKSNFIEDSRILAFWRDLEIFTIPSAPTSKDNNKFIKIITLRFGEKLPWEMVEYQPTLKDMYIHTVYIGANSNMRCDSFKSHMIINKLSKFL